MTLIWLNLYAVISNQIKQWSHLEKFCRLSSWDYFENHYHLRGETFSMLHTVSVHSHGNLFISRFERPVHFLLGHFDNSHSDLDAKEHLHFFSIRFY